MDANRFDNLLRSLIVSPSRRSVLGGTLAGAFGSLLHLAGSEAKGKKKKGKKCKSKCPGGTRNCDGACVPTDACCPSCTAGFTCLSNGSCGRSCAERACPAACGACNGNVEGQSHCIAQDACAIKGQDCTTMEDCPQGYQCQLNSCPPGVATRCMPLCTS